jgi:imidazolonepropionase-like amidohydrolase
MAQKVAYRARWVIDGVGSTALGNGAVVVEGDIILSVGTEVPSDAEDDELGDATLLPGLVDCHVHLPFDGSTDPVAVFSRWSVAQATVMALKHAQINLRKGITTVRDVSTPHGISIALRNAIETNEVEGPRIVAAGTHICITGGHGSSFGVEVDGVEEMRKAVRGQFKAGADFIKLMGTGGVYSMGLRETPDQIQLLLDEMSTAVEVAHGFGRRVASHSEGAEGIKVALDAGVDTIEHGNHLSPELAEQMVAQGAFLVATVGAFRNNLGRTDIDPQYVLTSIDLAEASETALQIAHEHGVKVACGTDRGTAMQMPWSSDYYLDEIKFLVQLGGFSAMEALQSATRIGAEALDVDRITGTLEAGKKADLVAASGNLLEDLNSLARPVLVVKNGQQIVAPRDGMHARIATVV